MNRSVRYRVKRNLRTAAPDGGRIVQRGGEQLRWVFRVVTKPTIDDFLPNLVRWSCVNRSMTDYGLRNVF